MFQTKNVNLLELIIKTCFQQNNIELPETSYIKSSLIKIENNM